ncbi:hypothetical protein FRC19_002379, partial [Serendipita sp. 401]
AVKSVNGQIKRGLPISPSAIPSIIDAILHAKNSTGIDDRKLLLEHILAFMSRLPPGPLQNKVQDHVIALFYDALPHPPVNFLPSMQIEMKIPTVVKGEQLGPGGTKTVSEGSIGRCALGHQASSTTSSTGTAVNGASSCPATGRSYAEPTQLLTPPSSAFQSAHPPVSAHPGKATNEEEAKPSVVPRYAYSSQFRAPSGQGNNPHMPLLGAAGTAYARAVVPMHPVPHSILPDPEMVFDLLMRRTAPPAGATRAPRGKPNLANFNPKLEEEYRGQGHGQPHPSGLSSMLFAFGDIIIHSLFRTSKEDDNVNLTSSYLDLSPLYGVDEAEMKKVRRKDGTGRLFEDCWADPRITMMPPAVAAVLIIFARNHNFVSLRLLQINESKKYAASTIAPPKSNDIGADKLFPRVNGEKLEWQDDDIFNRARLINCAFFMNAILGDYLSGILGTFREASEWCLNPLEEIRKGGKTIVNRAEGNSVSVEFNLLYRWHATLTSKDEEWLEQAVKSLLPRGHAALSKPKGSFELTEEDFKIISKNTKEHNEKIPPHKWVFGGLVRNKDGGFDDHELAHILLDATDNQACAYGARGIPAIMKVVEVMGIKTARKWGVCSLNEFRKFVGLKQYESFEEWNPTGDIAKVARDLYQHIDNLELYVGLMCEESKKPGDGAGLCPGYTISRAILADAVCLTRGDRFLTTDLTPYNLTSWGFQDCARDTKNGSMGGMFSKLLFRALPEYYPPGSVYAHFPFVVPPEMEHWLTKMNLHQRYTFNRPPKGPVTPVIPIVSAAGVQSVLQNPTVFKTMHLGSAQHLVDGSFFCFDNEPRHINARNMVGNALTRTGAMDNYAKYFREHTRRLLKLRSFRSGPNRYAVNIVRDVINVIPIHWICEEIAGIPLKSEEAPRGIYTEQEVYEMVTTIYSFVFINNDNSEDWPLREHSTVYAKILVEYIQNRLQASGNHRMLSIRGIKDLISHLFTQEIDHSDPFYQMLFKSNSDQLGIDELSSNVLSVIVSCAATLIHATTHVVDYYLDKEREAERKRIAGLATDFTPETNATLAGYVREALRHAPPAAGTFRKAAADARIEQGKDEKGRDRPPLDVKKGDRLFLSIAQANKDPIKSSTGGGSDKTPQIPFGRGTNSYYEETCCEKLIPAMLRAIFSLPNVQRGPGFTGTMNR